jgi:hypothetical protein
LPFQHMSEEGFYPNPSGSMTYVDKSALLKLVAYYETMCEVGDEYVLRTMGHHTRHHVALMAITWLSIEDPCFNKRPGVQREKGRLLPQKGENKTDTKLLPLQHFLRTPSTL